MSATIPPRLTPRDFAVLETMLADHLGADDLLVAAIRKKLSDARIVFAQDLPGDVVTIGSRVAFSVDEGWPEERRLVALEDYMAGQGHQSIASIRGMALLGQAVGDAVEIDVGGRIVTLGIHQVLYQPEADSKRTKRPDVRLVVNRDDTPGFSTRRSSVQTGEDPGPSAA